MNWPKSLASVVQERAQAINGLHVRSESGERVFTGTPTGFKAFDAECGGLPYTVVALAADTGVGKSALARAFAYGAVRSDPNHYSLTFNLEDGNDNLADRILGEHTGMGATKVRKLDFRANDRKRLEATSDVDGLDRMLVDDETYYVEDILEKSVRTAEALHKRGKRLVEVQIDYVQLLRVRMKGLGQTERIQQALLVLQQLAKAVGAPVLALSQVATKQIMKRGLEYYYQAKAAGEKGDDLYEGFAPDRGDFHWASEFDQFAKMVLAAFRPGPYRRKVDGGLDDDTRISIRILKNNFGPQKRFSFGWDGPLARVYDLAG